MRAGSYQMTHILVAHGAWVEQVCRKNWTAMHEAAKVGQVDILMLLLRNGGQVNHRDVTGVTPLAVAAEHGHFHITEILLHCGQSEKHHHPKGGVITFPKGTVTHCDTVESAEPSLDEGGYSNTTSCLDKS